MGNCETCAGVGSHAYGTCLDCHGTGHDAQDNDEINRLRARIAELESENALLREAAQYVIEGMRLAISLAYGCDRDELDDYLGALADALVGRPMNSKGGK